MGKIVSDFIWTEIFGCPEIGIPAIKSFAFHHPELYVHVFGFDEDLEEIAEFPQVVPMPLDRGVISKPIYYFSRITRGKSTINSDIIRRGFKRGHLGTAMLWEYIIRNVDSERFIHFDSDVIFLDRCIDDVSRAIKSGGLAGPIRNYMNNPHDRSDLKNMEDLCQTYFFGFDEKYIRRHIGLAFQAHCQGKFLFDRRPVLDFFDPVMMEMVENGAKPVFLNQDFYGGCDSLGLRNNKFAKFNNFNTPNKIDVGEKLVHFSAVGSGYNIYKNGSSNKSDAYTKYALDRFALYYFTVYGKHIGIDISAYDELIQFLIDKGIKKFVR